MAQGGACLNAGEYHQLRYPQNWTSELLHLTRRLSPLALLHEW